MQPNSSEQDSKQKIEENSESASANSALARRSNCSGTGDNQAHARRKKRLEDSPKVEKLDGDNQTENFESVITQNEEQPPEFENYEEASNTQRYFSKKSCKKYEGNAISGRGDLAAILWNLENIFDHKKNKNSTYCSVKVVALDWEVKRKLSDFEWLRNCIQKRFPGSYVKISFSFLFPILIF